MAPRKILVLGSTGPLGLLFVKDALEDGHILTLYVRSPSKVPEEIKTNKNVTIITGQLTDIAQLGDAVQNQDVVVSFLGPNSMTVDPDLYASAYKTVMAAMRDHGVRRILALATISVASPHDKFALSSTLAITGVRTVSPSGYRSMVNVGAAFEAAPVDGERGIEWTLFRVGGLAEGKESPPDQILATTVGGQGYSATVKRADVARWVTLQCNMEGDAGKWVGEMPLICSKGNTLLAWRPGFGRILGLTK